MKPQSPLLSRRRLTSLGALAGLCLLFTAPASLRAQIIYNQSFDSPLGGIPSGWARNPQFDPSAGVSQIATTGGDNYLRQQRMENGAANGNSFVYYNGDFGDGAVEDGILSDFTASVIFRPSGGYDGDGQGMMVRAGETDNTPAGYYVYLAGNKLQISLNPTNATSGRGSVLATSTLSFSTLASGTDYLFTVSAQDTTISGSLYAWDAGTSSFSTLLADVSVVNTTHASGYFGFRTSFSSTSSRSAYWKDLAITVVPEPSTVALMISAAGLCLFRRSRRK